MLDATPIRRPFLPSRRTRNNKEIVTLVVLLKQHVSGQQEAYAEICWQVIKGLFTALKHSQIAHIKNKLVTTLTKSSHQKQFGDLRVLWLYLFML